MVIFNGDEIMKKTLLALTVGVALVPSLAMAEVGDIVVRARVTNIAPDESSKLGAIAPSVGGPNAYLTVDSNTIPEIDFSYYITKNIAAELILAIGTKHTVTAHADNGINYDLGKVNLLPPTLLAQWHFNPDQTFDPYVGAGVSYVRAMDNNLTLAGTTPITIDRNNWGVAIQAGMDYNLENKWLLNVDVKKMWFDTTVKANGTKIDQLDVDPWVVSLGFGKKF
jgi:outer membrane protein